MIRARSIRPGAPITAASVRRPSALDEVPDADARAILERGSLLAIGPQGVLDAGGCAASASWDGAAFRVYDAAQACRGVFAGWPAAHRAMLDIALEWEARADRETEAVGARSFTPGRGGCSGRTTA